MLTLVLMMTLAASPTTTESPTPAQTPVEEAKSEPTRRIENVEFEAFDSRFSAQKCFEARTTAGTATTWPEVWGDKNKDWKRDPCVKHDDTLPHALKADTIEVRRTKASTPNILEVTVVEPGHFFRLLVPVKDKWVFMRGVVADRGSTYYIIENPKYNP